MDIEQIISIIIAGLIGLFLFANQFRLIFNRYLRTYNKEIVAFLNEKSLNLIETSYPNNLDWENSPFTRPKKVEISFFIVTLNGALITWNQKSYMTIIAESEKEKSKLFWLEIDTTYFRKPKLEFKQGKIRNHDIEISKGKKVKLIKVKERCPACGYKLNKDDFICPDCGINFK